MQERKSDKLKGIIFDLDGTLIDSFSAIMEGFNATLPLYGRNPLTLEETKSVVGYPLAETLGELVGEEKSAEATRIFREKYREVYLEKTFTMPHAMETLHSLHRGGYLLGVATNKHGGFSRKIIDHLGLSHIIHTVVGEGDTPRSKPHPDILLKNLESMSIAHDEAMFIGDSPVDIETGKKAGVKTVAVPTGHHTKEMLAEAGAELVVDDLSKLEEVL